MITAYLYVTLRCNARCKFCSIWQTQDRACPDLPLDLGYRLLDDLRRLGVRHVDFTGGEPLLYRHLPELISHAKSLGLFTSVTTNGLLYAQRARELEGRLDSLGFSLNGPDANTHDEVQGVSSFHKTVPALQLAKELKEPVHTHFTATDASFAHLSDTLDLARSLDIPLIVFPEFSYFGNKRFSVENLQSLFELSRSPGICINTASLEFLRSGGNNVSRPTCRAGRSALAVAPDGAILLPCFHRRQQSIPTAGELYNVYRSSYVQDLLIRSGRYEFCEGCTNWCYINPSFAYRLDRLAALHLLSAVTSARSIYGRRWIARSIDAALLRRWRGNTAFQRE